MKRLTALVLSLLLLVTAVIPMFAFNVSAANKAPNVLPAIREWEGGTGKFVPNSETVIVCNDSSAAEQIKLVQEFFADMLGLEIALSSAEKSNAIIFKLDSSACNGEKEGYELEATKESITIKASTEIGLLYGGITIVQSCYADGYFPVGKALDYPKYPVRSGMVDVARLYMPISELTEITKYMAWFKYNEIHVHINDNGKNNYSAFRLESDVPNLTAKDGYYTKEEYKSYQKEVLKYGMHVVTEIDTPFHSQCYSYVDGVKMLQASDLSANEQWAAGLALDIRDEATIQFVENLLVEYLGGEDPVIIKENNVVHLGIDEYPTTFKSYMCAYANRMIKHVNSDLCNNRIGRFWSGLAATGCMGGTVFEEGLNAQVNYWYEAYSGAKETVASGFPVINYLSAFLYVVPGSGDTLEGYEDVFTYEAMQKIYNEFQVNKYSLWNQSAILLPEDDPNMLGASFALWNDWGPAWIGLTYHDVIDRFQEPVALFAEKNWCGSETGNGGRISFKDFYDRYKKLVIRGGGADPFNNKAIENGDINIDFQENFPESYNESSVVNGEYVLNGTNPFTIAEGSVGFPSSLSFDITLKELPKKQTALFNGYEKYGIDIFIDTDGTIGIKAKLNEDEDSKKAAYQFTYDYKLPVGEKVSLTFSSDRIKTNLILANGFILEPKNSRQNEAYQGSAVSASDIYATLTIPLENVGEGIKATIDNIKISGDVADLSYLTGGVNVALGSNATASSLLNTTQTPNLAVDGKTGNRVAFGNDADEQWLLLDLGREVPINKLEINYYQTVSSYEILLSENGTDFIKVYETDKQKAGISKNIKIQLETAYKARYVKYLQRTRFEDEGKLVSGAIKEFAVISADAEFYSTVYDSAVAFANSLESSDSRKSKINSLAGELKKLLDADPFYYSSAESIRNQIEEAKTEIQEPEETPNEDSSAQPETPSQSQSATSENNTDEGGIDGSTIAIIVIAVVVVIGGAVVVILKKGKKD